MPGFFDSAASHHFCNDHNSFVENILLEGERMAVAVDRVNFPIEGCSTVELKFGQRMIKLENLMFSPKLCRNLISGSRLDMEGITYRGGGWVERCKCTKTRSHGTLQNYIRGFIMHI